ncbi:sperm-associated antigen 17 isoform X2 [Oryzias melastigma]|uniref:sperm-associated antigen 17 isoform X2 n=1 Tax=Oryzias melastigma TaxID=30732 RepID=UPI000CF7FD3B|nr:sperm-associated antigen 17 isoform X2 [Oryzias melastigma]
MPPKKTPVKKPSRVTPAAPNKDTGAASLLGAQLDEDSWRSCVSLVVGNSPEDEELIQALASAVQQPQRKLFTLLTRNSILMKISELGNLKGKKVDDVSLFNEVLQSARVWLDAGEDIPFDLMAKILKLQLLQVKSSDQQRREAEQTEAEKAKGNPPPDSTDKAKGSDKRGKTPSKPVTSSMEKKTKLLRRGEVEPPTYIDDEPDWGPQHYVLLAGFYQPLLIAALDDIGVHVANVIKLCCDRTQIHRKEQQSCDESEQSQAASAFSGAELAVQARRLDLFWSELRAVLDSGPPHSRLHDVVPLSYTVQDIHTQDPEDGLELGGRIFEGVANLIYDCLQWRRQHQHYLDSLQLLDVSGSGHKPAEVAPTPPLQSPISSMKAVCKESLRDQVDMCYYNSLLDLVPPEACSVPVMLHCMLEQVVISKEQLAVSNHSEEPEADENVWLDSQLVRYMLQSVLPQIPTEEEKRLIISDLLTAVQKDDDKKKLLEEFEEEDAQRKTEAPLVIKHLDERALRLRDISVEHGFNPAEVEASMMRLSPVLTRIQSVEKRRNHTSRWTSVRQQLQHFCTDETVTWAEVERLFHLSVFEAMALTTVDQRGVLLDAVRPPEGLQTAQRQSQTLIPWDDPETFAKQQLLNLRNKGTDEMFPSKDLSNKEFLAKGGSHLDLSDLQRCRQRSLNDRRYTEHHSADVLQQVLLLASEEYRCLDAFRGTHTDTLYIFCHNPMNPDRQNQEFWDVALHTDVKFRKYLEHVADTITDWTREEESKKEVFGNKSFAEAPEEDGIDPVVTEEDTLEPVIRKGSLKAWKAEQEQLQEEEMAKRLKTPKSKGKQQKEAQPSAEKGKDLSAGKKSRPNTAGSQREAPKEPIVTTEQREEPSKSFQGYSMDGQLIHVSGHVQNLFPSDGGHITVENVNFVEGSRLMKVSVKKDGHHFYTHINRVVVQPVKPPEGQRDQTPTNLTETSKVERKMVKQGSFTAELDNKIHISYSFYGPTGEYTGSSPEAKGETSKASTQEPPSPSTTRYSKGCEDQPDAPPPGPISGFNVSLPSGLLLQFQPEDTQGTILVRQSFPLHVRKGAQHLRDKSLSSELSRIITGQGDVVRFLKDGSTEVLCADGSVSVRNDAGPVSESDGVENPKKSETAAEAFKPCWQTTTPTGSRICTDGTTNTSSTPLLTHKATDPITNQVMLSREDLVVSVENPDGSRVVEHADGTRITSFLQNLPQNGQKPEVSPLDWCHQSGCKYEKEAITSRNTSSRNEQVSSLQNTETDNEVACEMDDRGASNNERVVMVEKEGLATVLMHPQRHTAQAFLADGTVVTGNSHGEYEVFPSSAGFLQIQRDGTCIYSSDPLVSPNHNKAGTYTMSHADMVACNMTDDDGNHFQVMEDGQISVLKLSSASSSRGRFEEEEDGEPSGFKHRRPRLFLLHADGSGTEFLSSHSVEEWLDKAYSDPTVALLKEPLPNKPDEFGITILKPSPQSVWSQWLLGKRVPDVTPPNLRNHCWHDFPGVEKRSPGPPFGTNAGVGLTLRERRAGPAALLQPVRSCPEVLEMRELHEHRAFTKTLRDAVDSRLKKYIESLMEREQLSEERRVKDPRTEEEQEHARELCSLILCFPEEADPSNPVDSRRSVGSLYCQGVRASMGGARVPEDSEKKAGHSSEALIDGVDSKWSERLSKHRCELDQEKTYKDALRKKNIVPYFHPENFPLFQSLLQNQASVMRRHSTNLPLILESKSDEGFMNDVDQECTPRPLNPTPSQSESHAAETEVLPGSRPSNPTPHTAGEGSLKGSTRRCKSVQVDVTGKLRKTKVRLPNCIVSSKARRVPNQNQSFNVPFGYPLVQFLTVEEPVRRKCRTASLADPEATIRGFQLLPWSVDFGVVEAGTLSTAAVFMKNVGVDTCRFHVKQPPLATGLRVFYNPGLVAAGLQTELKVQLFAMSSPQTETEPKKYISQDIIIHTETDILYLPVTAIIVPERLKDEENTKEQKKSDSTSKNAPQACL